MKQIAARSRKRRTNACLPYPSRRHLSYKARVPTWKLTLEYDGAAFCGWQIQANGLSVQQAVEEALARLHDGEAVKAPASGRTDAGVHARGQVVSIAPTKVLPQAAYERGLNTLLPQAVAVVHVEPAPEGFDARRWAHGKRYVYRVLNAKHPSPLRAGSTWLVHPSLDLAAMKQAAKLLLGEHDFSAMRASDCQAKTTVRELRRLDVERQGDELVFTVEATAFLKHMVRNLVGTLVEVGMGRRAADSMPALLASGDRTRAGRTAPPQGLCLDEVFYDLARGRPD